MSYDGFLHPMTSASQVRRGGVGDVAAAFGGPDQPDQPDQYGFFRQVDGARFELDADADANSAMLALRAVTPKHSEFLYAPMGRLEWGFFSGSDVFVAPRHPRDDGQCEIPDPFKRTVRTLSHFVAMGHFGASHRRVRWLERLSRSRRERRQGCVICR
jgi:hypothetical protein